MSAGRLVASGNVGPFLSMNSTLSIGTFPPGTVGLSTKTRGASRLAPKHWLNQSLTSSSVIPVESKGHSNQRIRLCQTSTDIRVHTNQTLNSVLFSTRAKSEADLRNGNNNLAKSSRIPGNSSASKGTNSVRITPGKANLSLFPSRREGIPCVLNATAQRGVWGHTSSNKRRRFFTRHKNI